MKEQNIPFDDAGCEVGRSMFNVRSSFVTEGLRTMITLLDYGAGNVRSVINAIESLGEKVRLVETPEDLRGAEKLVFPGVGHFGNMMWILREKAIAGSPSGLSGLGPAFLRHLPGSPGPV